MVVFDLSSSRQRTGSVQSLLDQMSSLDSLENAVGKIRATPTALGRLIHLEVDPDTFQVIFSAFSVSV